MSLPAWLPRKRNSMRLWVLLTQKKQGRMRTLCFLCIVRLDRAVVFIKPFSSSAADGTCDGVLCDQHGACVPKTARGRDRQCVCVTGWKGDGRRCDGNSLVHLRFNEELTYPNGCCFIYHWYTLSRFFNLIRELSYWVFQFLWSALYSDTGPVGVLCGKSALFFTTREAV